MRQFNQGLIQQQDLDRLRLCRPDAVIKGDSYRRTRALARQMIARVVDQDAPHHLRRDAKEVAPILPGYSILSNQPHEGFMDKRRRLERMILTFASQVGPRSPPQLVINERQHSVARRDVTFPPRLEQSADLAGAVDRNTF